MSWEPLVVRARGLSTRLLDPSVLAAFEQVTDGASLASACAAAGLGVEATPRAIEALARERAAADLVILARWPASRVLAPLLLDEDRRALRALARAITANVPERAPSPRAIPTSATSFAEVRVRLGDHPLALAFDAGDLFDVELALARCYHAAVRTARDAIAIHVAQVADVDNAVAALLVAERGGDAPIERIFVDGGRRIDRATFVTACASIEAARERLAGAFAETPLARAVYAAAPGAIEDAALAWHLATQARLRRIEPLGLGAVVHVLLQRRAEGRTLRRAAWSAVLGGAS